MDERDSGGTEPEAAAPAAPAAVRAEVRPATTPNRYEAHPAFQTGEVLLDPALREEMAAYWRAQAEWEKTRQGPAPRPPRVMVEARAAEEPSEAAAVRGAMDEEDAAGAAVETAAETVAEPVAGTAAETVTATVTATVAETEAATAAETVTASVAETVTATAAATITETAAETAVPMRSRPESSAPLAVDRREATIEARRARAERAGRTMMIAGTAVLLVLGVVLAGVLRGPGEPMPPPSAAATSAPSLRATAPPVAASTFTPEAAPSASAAPASTPAPMGTGAAARTAAPKPAPPQPQKPSPAPSPPPTSPVQIEGAPEF